MILNLFTLTSEILYLYFLLKETILIKSKKQKIFLICGICFSIMCSGAIFESTIFKYLLLTLFLYLSLKLVDRHTSISVLFTITFILLYKFIIEILTVFSLYEILDVNIIIIIQPIPDTTTINAQVVFTIGGVTTTTYPFLNCDCTSILASQVRTRTRYKTRVSTTVGTGVFKYIGDCRLPCKASVDAQSIPLPTVAPATNTPN